MGRRNIKRNRKDMREEEEMDKKGGSKARRHELGSLNEGRG